MSAQPFPAPAGSPVVSGAQTTAPVAFYPLATNATAIASVVLGSIAWMIPFIGGLAAVITGHIALSQARRRGEDGSHLAKTALWLGYGSIIAWFLLIVVMAAAEFPVLDLPGATLFDS